MVGEVHQASAEESLQSRQRSREFEIIGFLTQTNVAGRKQVVKSATARMSELSSLAARAIS